MLAKFSVKKPYTIAVAILLILILGFVSYSHMTLDLMPSINLPYAVISTSYVGASPEEVEQTVTKPIEQRMASVNNIKSIQSISSEHLSMVILEFQQDTNMDSAVIEMRETLDQLSTAFTDDIGSPMITKINPDMMPVMVLSVSVDHMSTQQASQYIDERLLPEIQSVDGVASASASGLLENMVDVTLDKEKIDAANRGIRQYYQGQARTKMRQAAREEITKQIDQQIAEQQQAMIGQGMPAEQAALLAEQAKQQALSQVDEQVDAIVQQQMKQLDLPNLEITAQMVSGVLQGQNFSMPAGSVSSAEGVRYMVRVGDALQSVEDVQNLVVLDIPGYKEFKLSDLATVAAYDNADQLYSRVNGEYAVMLTLQKQPDVSTAMVANAVQDKIASMQQEQPDVHFHVLMDQGEYVDIMIDTVLNNLLFGAVLAIVILFIFLRRIKPTVIVGASILISVVTAFVLMYFAGITLNMISMSGLALGVGMLVDNSIVVIENIFRMRSEGVSMKRAAIEGAKEVSGAITSSTLTTVIVFVPIVFTQGITRQLFTDMALTIAFSLLASLLVALTLVPAAASKFLHKAGTEKRTWIDKMTDGYVRLLDRSLHHKWVCLALSVVLLCASVGLALSSGTELFPSMDTGEITVSVEMPQTYTQADTFAALDQLSDILLQIDALDTLGVIHDTGSSASNMLSSMMGGGTTIYASLKEDRTVSTDQVLEQIRTQTAGLPFTVSASSSNMDMAALSGGQVVIYVYGNNLDALRTAALSVATQIQSVDGTAEVDNGLGKTSDELRITVDKTKAISKGVTVAQVYMAVQQALAEETAVSSLSTNGVDTDIYVRDNRDEPVTDRTLADLTIESASGSKVKLADVATITQAQGFSSIHHKEQDRVVTVTASVQDGYNVGHVSEQIEALLNASELPDGCRFAIGGELESIRSSFNDLTLMLVLAIVFIYLVMVAQFQSLLSPFIVMFTLPLAFTGGFLALFLSGMPISIVALIGFVILVGVVVNNGIVFVDYANQQCQKGLSVHQALLRTGRNRIRPILMTALTTILALCTMAFDPSSGAELMRPMAIATIGGMAYATLLTLFVVPAMYALFHKRRTPSTPQPEGETVCSNAPEAVQTGTPDQTAPPKKKTKKRKQQKEGDDCEG